MARSDLQSAIVKWQARANQARSSHLPDYVWKPLMQKDFASVMAGHSPMADAEVNDAMRSAVGLSPINDPSKGHGILDVLGNIPSDIQNIVTGFIPGAVGYITSLPQQAADISALLQHDPATMKKYGWENPDNLASVIRDMSNTPIVGPLIPGLHTIAAASTDQGRQWIEEHPVSTVLDVGAAVAAAGKLGLFGRAAAEGETAAMTAAKETATTPLEELKLSQVEKTPLAALQKAEPYRATGRAALKAVEKISGGRLDRPTIENFLFNHGAHPILREWATRPADQINTLIDEEHVNFLKTELMQETSKLSEEDQQLLYKAGQDGNPGLLTGRPDLEALYNATQDWIESAARRHPLLRQIISPWGREYTYTRGHPVVKAFDAAEQASTDQLAAEINIRNVTARLNEATAAYNDVRARLAGVPQPGWHKELRVAADNLKKAEKQAGDAKTRYENAVKNVTATHKHYNTVLSNSAPAAFYPYLDVIARHEFESIAQEKFATDQAKLDTALGQIRNATTTEQIGRAIEDPVLAKRTMEEVERTWTTFARDRGVDPIYMPNIHESKIDHLLHPTIFPGVHYADPFVLKKSAFNLSRTTYDFTVGLTGYHYEMLIEAGQREWVDNYIKHFVMDSADLHDDLTRAMGGPSLLDVRKQTELEQGRNWAEFDPETYGMKQYFPTDARGGKWMIPIGVKRTLDYLKVNKQHPIGPVQAVRDKAMNVWRFSVLSTPRHISHISLGGMTMGTLQDPLFGVKFARHYKMIKAILNGDDRELVARFGRNIHGVDQHVGVGTGKSLGRLTQSAWKHPIQALNRWEEQVTQMYKINAMLIGQEKGLGVDQAVAMANKWFVDRSAMLPFERVVFNKIFPFYGFTRHLFRYLMTYPTDHPYTASILTHFANQHEQDWNSGLARNLSFMFFLGPTDSNGNITGIDYRSIDPFRSFYNDFTLAGFWSQVNPGLQFLAQASGLNILSGTQELYPHTHYDPNTGQLVADRPSNLLWMGLEQLIPETTAAEAYFGLTDQLRNLKLTDPAAYRHRVLTAMGIPFYPETFNLPAREQTYQMKRYRDAQTSISQALQTGDFSKAKRYNYVPVPSLLAPYLPPNMKYISPQQAEYVYNALRSRLGSKQVSLHAILPKPTRTRTR